ncbi:MAG: LCP family protein [Acidimicrobiia bacterium]
MKLLSKIFIILTFTTMTLLLVSSTISYGLIKTNTSDNSIKVSKHTKHLFNDFGRYQGSFYPTKSGTFFILVIGNDYRPGVEGARADAIHLVGINTDLNKASIINFPRDTNVQIPGHGTSKINAANAYGGSTLTAQTLEQLTGVSISYILEANFAAFKGLIDDFGGIEVNVEKEMHDSNSGSNFSPGINKMDGGQALAFSRDRHSFPIGDLQRTKNQAKLLIAGLAQMQKTKTTIPDKFISAVKISKHLKLTNLSLKDIFFLLQQASKVDPTNVSNIVVPWSKSNTLSPKANDLFADFKDNAVIDSYKE